MGSSETGGPHLTIFYSGTVNVYDHVPAEKAHAIMLLLSGCSSNHGSAISSSTTSDHALLLGDDQMRAAEKTPQHAPKITINAPAMASNTVLASSSSAAAIDNTEICTISTTGSSLTAQATFLPLRPPSTASPAANVSSTIARLHRTQQICEPAGLRSQAELPFARKASLARFLQKRKDRVEATKAEEEAVTVIDADESLCKRMKL